MATITDSLKRSSINIENISKSLESTKGSVSSVNESVSNISRIVATNTRIKRELFSRSNVLISRREEAAQRKEKEDAIEASQVSSSPVKGFAFTSKSDKGPLGRLLGFLGFITAGWIVENLPTWIFMGKEFISRIQTFGRSMYNMVEDMKIIINSFGKLLKDSFNAIIRLDFDEFSEGSVAQSFNELNSAVQGLGDDITETFRLFTTPLTEALETGEQAPGLGEQREETMFPDIPQEPGAPSRVTGTAKQALDIISKYESQSAGGYEAVNQIGIKGGYGTLGYSGPFGGMKQHKGQRLTQMSVREIMELQRDIPGMSNAEWIKRGRLHAVGRYQIIGSTLKGLVDKGVIKPSDTFDETTQDVAGMYILKTSGIGAYYGPKRYATNQERAIIEKARREPVSYAPTPPPKPKTPTSPPPPSGKGNGFLTASDLMKIKTLSMTPDYKDWYGNNAFLNPAAGKAFLEAQKAYGKDIPINSAYRSYQHQKAIGGKYGVVAAPGTSKHGLGLGLDLQPGTPDYKWMRENGPKFGWYYANIKGDPYHFEYRGGGSTPSAEIASQPRSQQPSAITPDRKGPGVVIIDDTQPQVPQVSYPSAQQPSYTPTISEFKLLNNFIKNKLLIDLAYL
jgi:hypothetical protein